MEDNARHVTAVNAVKDLGKIIRERREAANLTLDAAAAMCNVGRRFLFEIENGKHSVQFNRVLQVAAKMGIQIFAEQRGGRQQGEAREKG